MLKKLLISLSLGVSLFGMHEAELNINDVDLEVGFKFDMGQFNNAVEPDSTFVGVKFLNADKKYSDINPKSYFEVNFLMQRAISDTNLKAGIGVKLNATGYGNKNFLSLPIGMHLLYNIPNIKVPVYIGGYVYYAPKVLSMQDAKSFFEYRFFVDVNLIKNAGITAGYRNIYTNYDISNGDVNLNHAAYIGVKFRF